MKKCARFARAVLLACVTIPVASHAGLIVVEPDDFAEGADISSAVAGVTLSVSGWPGAQVLSLNGFSPFNHRNVATTGERVFAHSFTLPGDPTGEDKAWDDLGLGILRADFARPADFVQIDIIFDDDDIGFLRAFDISGALLAEAFVSGDGRGAVPFVRTSISRPTADIAYMLAAGYRGESLLLDNLQVNVAPPQEPSVPEPATLALTALGLAGIGCSLRRKGQ